MSKTKITSVSLQALLDAADDKTDFKAILISAISALADSEGLIIVLNDAAVTAAQNIKDLTAKLDELEIQFNEAVTERAKAEEDLDSALEQLTELGEQLEAMQKNRGDRSLIVTIDKKQYKLLGNRIHLKGEKQMTALEVSKRPDLLEQLLNIGSGALVPVE